MTPKEILTTTILGNTLENLGWALILFVGINIVLHLLRNVLLKEVHQYALKTHNKIDDAIIEVLRHIGSPFYFIIALYVAVQHLVLHPIALFLIEASVLIVIVHESIELLERIACMFLAEELEHAIHGPRKRHMLSILSTSTKVIFWTLGLLLVLSNVGFDVSSLLAGLGIGGIAISLALQNILGDLFSSFSIMFDKPFVIGDLIEVDGYKGTVRNIGLKTTRIQAWEGEEIVFSNTHLTGNRILNYKKMEKRHILFTFDIPLDTPPTKLKIIPNIVQSIIKKMPHTEFERAHFKTFGADRFIFEVVYFVLNQDIKTYMDIQEKINLSILEDLGKQNIQLALPTQIQIGVDGNKQPHHT